MPFGIRSAREAEDGRGGHGNADAVGDDGFVGDVAWMLVAGVLATDWVAHAVTEVDACVAEAHAR